MAYSSIEDDSDTNPNGDLRNVKFNFTENNVSTLINGSPLREAGLKIHWKDIPVSSIQQIEIIAVPLLDSDSPRTNYFLINIFTKAGVCLDSLSCFDNKIYSDVSLRDLDTNIKDQILGATFYFPMDSILSALFECKVDNSFCSSELISDDKEFFIEMTGRYNLKFIKEEEENKPLAFSERDFDPEKGLYIGTVDSHKVFLKGKVYDNNRVTEKSEFETDSIGVNDLQISDPHLNDSEPISYEVGVKIEKSKNYSIEFIGFQNNQDGEKAQADSIQGSQNTKDATTTQGLEMKWSLVLDQLTLKGNHSYTDIIEGFEEGRTTIDNILKRRNIIGIDYSVDPDKWIMGGELTYSNYYRGLHDTGINEDEPQLDIYAHHYPY